MSMANNAGRHLRQIVANVDVVVGVELLMSVQALELRVQAGRPDGTAVSESDLSTTAQKVSAMLRSTPDEQGKMIAHLTRDVVLYPQVRTAASLVKQRAVLTAAHS